MSMSQKRALLALAGLIAACASLYFNFIMPFGLISWAFLLVAGLFVFLLGRVGRP
jgi:hypothetical protein